MGISERLLNDLIFLLLLSVVAILVVARSEGQTAACVDPDCGTIKGVIYGSKGVKTAGDSTRSNGVPNTPHQPTDVTATQSGANVTVSWVMPSPDISTGAQVERCTGIFDPTNPANNCLNTAAKSSYWTVLGTVGAGITTYSDSTASVGTTYVYRVKSYNAAGATMPWGGDDKYTEA